MRPTNIRIASGISILGAIVAFIALGFELFVGEGEINIAAALFIFVIALLFFGLAGQFYENGIVKSQAVALTLVALIIAAIVAAFCLQNAFELGFLVILAICAIIPAVIAASESAWYKYEKI